MPEPETPPDAGEQQSVVIDVPRLYGPKAEDKASPSQPSSAASAAAQEPEPVPAAGAAETAPAAGKEAAPAIETPEAKPPRDARIDEYYRLKALERQYLEELEKTKREAPKPAATPVPTPADDPEPVWDPDAYAAQGGYDGFVKQLGRWSARQERREWQAAETARKLQSESAQRVSQFAERVQRAAIPDYLEVVNACPRPVIYEETRTAILESELGPQLAYHLAKHPEEIDRLNSLSVRAQLVELGKLESRLTGVPNGTPVPPTSNPGLSKAPPPITPLKAKGAKPLANAEDLIANNADLADVAAVAGIRVNRGRFERRR